jgi:putative ABC transport system substrate-binding protein
VKILSQCSVVSKYILIFVVCALLFAPGLSVEAQQQNKINRIGVLLSGSRTPVWSETFRQALRDLGYVEGQNITIEYRKR